MALNTLKVRETADAVMVLTDKAIYICRYDYQLEKVSRFQRIELDNLSTVQHGAYITDTLAPHSLDQARNHGVVLYFETAAVLSDSKVLLPDRSDEGTISTVPTGDLSSKVNASISVPTTADPRDPAEGRSASPTTAATPRKSFIACKLASEVQVVMQSVVPSGSSSTGASVSLARLVALESQSPELLAECLCSAIQSAKSRTGQVDASQFIVESPIISAATAKQSTSIVDKVSNRLYKALWI
ncbi:hypothetical protein FBU31_005907 [Coemansia sp. 'formosensis']|nr:hypothetical protein FBU31_005907 [Coemansia sp. 'formosensis']